MTYYIPFLYLLELYSLPSQHQIRGCGVAAILGDIISFWANGGSTIEGATEPTAVAEKNVEDVVDLALICPLCKHLCVEATVVSNGVLSLASCAHLFCETCIAQHVREHMSCPACEMFCDPSMLQPDPRARKAISQLLVAQPGYAEKPLLEHETKKHKHWTDSTKADVLQLWKTHGWHAVHVRYPGLAWTTASYWRNHPGVRQHGSGGHAALNDQQRFEVAQAICRSRRCGEDLGLAQVRQLALAKASPDSNFKASYTWMQGLFTEFGLAGPFKPHPRSAAWFPKPDQLASDSSDDTAPAQEDAQDRLLTYFAEIRARRILIELRGLDQTNMIFSDLKGAVALATSSVESRGSRGADNVVINDESRWKSGGSQHRVIDKAHTRRALTLSNMSTSFAGITLLSSFSGAGDKLGLMIVFANKNRVQVEMPSRATAHIPPAVSLPDPLVHVASSISGWNNNKLYKEDYREFVMRPYQAKALEARVAAGQLIVLPTDSVSSIPLVQRTPLTRKRRLLEMLLIHDAASAHLTPWNVYAFHKDRVSTVVVPGGCTKFAQWLDVFYHQVLRPLVDDEVARRLRLRTETKACTEKQWHQLFVDSIASVVFNPAVAAPLQLIAELRSLGVTSKLDGTEDDAIHIRVAASLMPTVGLQSLAEARLLELARISREEEEKSAAHAARIWQESKAVKEENASKRRRAKEHKDKKEQADGRRLKRRRAEGGVARHSESDSSEGDTSGYDGDEEGDEAEKAEVGDAAPVEEFIFDTIAEVTPLGHQTARKPRAVDRTLEHAHIAFRWSTGWERGQIGNLLSPERKKSQHFVPDANFDVQFLSDTHPREVALTLDRYSAAQNAPVGSWVLFRPQ